MTDNSDRNDKDGPGRRRFGGLRSRLVGWFLLIGILPVLAGSYRAFEAGKKATETRVAAQLMSVADLQKEELQRWLNDRLAELRIFAAAPSIRELLERTVTGRTDPTRRDHVRNMLGDIASTRHYDRISLLTPGGTIVASTRATGDEGADFVPTVEAVLHQREPIIGKVRPEAGNRLLLQFAGPVFQQITGDENPGKVVGVLVLDIDINRTLLPLIGPWTGMGRTGETLLVRRQGDGIEYLNRPRHRTAGPPSEHVHLNGTRARAAVFAAEGDEGLMRGPDYRGEEVLAAYRHISFMDWGLVTKIDLAEAFAPVRTLRIRVLLASGLTILVAIAVAIWLARSITRPLLALEQLTRGIAAGNFTTYPEVQTKDEIGSLARSFTIMEKNLAESQRQLEEYNRSLESLILERTRDLQASQAQLQDYSERLEIMVEERSRQLTAAREQLLRQEKLAAVGKLAASVRHDLRNPLGVIGNAVYYLQRKLPDADDKVRKYLDLLADQVQRCEAIISDLLDFSQERPLELGEGDLNEVLASVLTTLKRPANVKIEKALASDLPALRFDRGQLQRVFQNLAMNAVQAMVDGGTLQVCTQTTPDGGVAVAFRDSGMGIDPEAMAKIFEPLYTTKAKGIGLGLSIVKDIVERHGGSLTVESDPGRGAVFTVTLPEGNQSQKSGVEAV